VINRVVCSALRINFDICSCMIFRSLEDLSSKAYQEAMEKVKEIHRVS